MKLSTSTKKTLANFAIINPGIILEPGKLQRTKDVNQHIYAEAEFDFDLKDQFCLHDIQNFLNLIAAMNDPEIEFRGDVAVLKSEQGLKTQYRSANALTIIAPKKTTGIAMNNPSYVFTLEKNQFDEIKSVAPHLSSPHLYILNKDDGVYVYITDRANKNTDDANHSLIRVGDVLDKDAKPQVYSIEYLKFIPDDYEVTIISQGIARFSSKTSERRYYVTMNVEKESE